jgi:hypothetical protein
VVDVIEDKYVTGGEIVGGLPVNGISLKIARKYMQLLVVLVVMVVMVVVEEDITIKVDQVMDPVEILELLDKDVLVEEVLGQQHNQDKKVVMVQEEEIGESVEDLRMHQEIQEIQEMLLQKMVQTNIESCLRA